MASEVKYSAEQVAALVDGVAAGKSPEVLANELGKSVRSVVAKLSQMKLYKAKDTVKAEGRVTKSQLVLAVEAKLGLEVGVLASLEKADKAALEALASAV